MNTVVLIPAYKPDNALLELAAGLKAENFDILVVNDGSGAEYDGIFGKVAEYAAVTGFEKNHGKGAALRLGISMLGSFYPGCDRFITADADGQHSIRDICRVNDELEGGSGFVLTVRSLTRDAPLRSRFGNALSRFVFTVVNGRYFSDNQSGLRGFSIEHAQWLLNVSGEKYDYEMNVLMYAAAQEIKIRFLPVETIYLDGNKSSHFNPLLDTLRIYRTVFTTARASLLALLLYELLIISAALLSVQTWWFVIVPASGFLCTLVCFLTNKFIIFRGFRYAAGMRIFSFAAIRYCFYTFVCLLLMHTPAGSLPLVFNIALVLCVPLKYLLHMVIARCIDRRRQAFAKIRAHKA